MPFALYRLRVCADTWVRDLWVSHTSRTRPSAAPLCGGWSQGGEENATQRRGENAMQDDGVEAAVHNAIAHRAYQLWKRRGHPLGSPEVDWLRAEQELAAVYALPYATLPMHHETW
jgi:hypothetical protein